MNRLSNTLEQAVKNGHISNTSKGHEKWFASLLVKNGFSSTTLEDVGISKLDVRNGTTSSNSNLWFISEPLGSQNTPDFLVSDENGNLFYIELKSSKADKITWNGGYPKDNFIYLFSSGQHDAQTVFMGKDCWDADDRTSLLEHAKKLKQLTDEFNKTLSGDQTYYTRNMFTDNTRYYSRDNRKKYEQAVFDYVRSFSRQTESV